MRFSEGGEYLVAVVGSSLKVLGVPGLDTFLTANAERGYAMRHVAFSQDGKVLAYTSSGDVAPDQPVRVDVNDLQELRTSSWKLQFAPHSLSLSPDGKRILFSAFPLMQGPHDADVLLYDTYSGKLLRSFDANYPGGHTWGAGWVQFLGPDRFMTSPSGSVNTANDLKRGTLKIWNVDTEKLIQELSYGPYGVRGEFAAFATSPVVAAITGTEDPAKVGCDEDCGSFRKWLLFDISKSEPVYVSDALHSGKSAGPFDGEIRMSKNGKIVAVPQGEKVELYGITF
jgi:WD40 repeat protein